MRYAMVINKKRCIGCDACALACKNANGTPKGVYWSHVVKKETGEYPNAAMDYTPMLCMHCEDAPCVLHCPTGASVKHEDGIVTVDYDKCIGCRMCVTACPYGARWYIPKTDESAYTDKPLTLKEERDAAGFTPGTVSKCVFCRDKVQAGEQPACVAACPVDARIFGDIDDPESEVSKYAKSHGTWQLASEYATNPSVSYV